MKYNPKSALSLLEGAISKLTNPAVVLKPSSKAVESIDETLVSLRDALKEKIADKKVPISDKQDRRLFNNSVDAAIAAVRKSKSLSTAITWKHGNLGNPYNVEALINILMGNYDLNTLEEFGEALLQPA